MKGLMTDNIDKNLGGCNNEVQFTHHEVLVVEDDPVMQKRIKKILAMLDYKNEQICYASTLVDAMNQIEAAPKLTLALVDLVLPDGNGVDFIQALRNQDTHICILVISAWSTDAAILSALRSGATGYVLKERDDLEVSISIRNVLRGGAPIDPFIARCILKQLSSDTSCEIVYDDFTSSIKDNQQVLSKREYEILQLVGNGLSNKDIATELDLSIYTIQTHIKHIYSKLTVSSRTKAVSTAKFLGFL